MQAKCDKKTTNIAVDDKLTALFAYSNLITRTLLISLSTTPTQSLTWIALNASNYTVYFRLEIDFD